MCVTRTNAYLEISMAEEKKINEPKELAQATASPKKRGRKKKTDTETVSDKLPSPSDLEVSADTAEAEPKPTVKKEGENSASVEEAKPKRRGRRKKAEIVGTELPADAEIGAENTDSKNVDEPLVSDETAESADEAVADAPIADGGDNAQALINEENTDCPEPMTDGEVCEDGCEPEPSLSEAVADEEKNEEITQIEHFSDTYEIKYLSDELDSQKSEEKEESEDEIEIKDEEYENLKIFEDEEPKIEHEPKQKRVHTVSPDYKEYNPEKPRRVDARFDLIELFVYTLVAIMLITTFFFKHSRVSGESMINTLQDGDHLIISDFLYEPKQFDIVVVHDPMANDVPMVKRIIAVGGQTVRIERRYVSEKSNTLYAHYVTEVYVDGTKVPDKYCYYTGSDLIVPNVTTEEHELISYKAVDGHPERYEYLIFEYKVPLNEVYVMGDHRNDSKDSRAVGSIHKEKILGHVLIRFFPFEKFGTVD